MAVAMEILLLYVFLSEKIYGDGEGKLGKCIKFRIINK